MKGTQPPRTWEATYFRLRRFLESKHPGVLGEYEQNHSSRWRSPKEHGFAQSPNQMNSRTLCRCGREFGSDRGLEVHIGKMNKLSSMVLSKREEIIAGREK